MAHRGSGGGMERVVVVQWHVTAPCTRWCSAHDGAGYGLHVGVQVVKGGGSGTREGSGSGV